MLKFLWSGKISYKKHAFAFSIVLILFLIMGSVSAIDSGNTGEDANNTVLFSQNFEIPSDSILEMNSPNYFSSVDNNGLLGFCSDDILQNNVKQSVLSGKDIELYYKNGTTFKVVLSDSEGSLLTNQSIIFTINNINYTRTTDNDGVASIAINLKSGTYNISSFYVGNENYDSFSTSNTVNVLPTISGYDIEKYYRNDTQYYATFLDGQGNYLKDTEVTFNINGVFYQRKTNEKGNARLNINLPPGEYIITAINSHNGEMYSNNIVVLPTLSANDLNMRYRDGNRFCVKVLDDVGKPLSNSNVIFNINGVFYTRTSDDEGNAYLNINLNVGEYVITATNNKGLSVSNKINIAKGYSIIKADDACFIAGIDNEYSVVLSGLNNKTVPFNTIKFSYGGTIITAVTDENGEAKLLILNLSKGKYDIEYEFEGNMNYYSYKSHSTIIVDDSINILTGNDLKMSYMDGSKFKVTLTDLDSVPMANETVTFNVGGRLYDRITDENGVASLNINLNPGNYEISYSYSSIGARDYNKGSNTITVSKIQAYLSTSDLTFLYGGNEVFTATLTDSSKNPVEGIDVTFNICGKSYVRTTDASGVAKLNINMQVGYYDIVTSLDSAFYTASSKSNHILIDGAIFTHAYDISVYPKVYQNFSVTLLDAYKNPITGADIEFTYNGITKHAKTDREGIARVSVGGLPKGDYPIVYKFAERNTVGQSYIFVSEKPLNCKNTISDLSIFLSDSNNCQVSNTEIVALANRLTGKFTNPLDKATAIYNYVRDTIRYGYYYDTKYGAVGTLHAKIGNCVDQSHLSIALYRAAGLPARYVHGTCQFNDGDTYGHVWTQVLVGNTWIVSDTINGGNSLGRVANWNNYNYKLHGYFPYIVF
jgi:hypothetical protein